MTAIALQLPSGRGYPRRSFTRLVLNLINGFREAQAISYRYAELSHLSDDALAARKLRREDLPRIALTGRA
jgi:hypothetical protein